MYLFFCPGIYSLIVTGGGCMLKAKLVWWINYNSGKGKLCELSKGGFSWLEREKHRDRQRNRETDGEGEIE